MTPHTIHRLNEAWRAMREPALIVVVLVLLYLLGGCAQQFATRPMCSLDGRELVANSKWFGLYGITATLTDADIVCARIIESEAQRKAPLIRVPAISPDLPDGTLLR